MANDGRAKQLSELAGHLIAQAEALERFAWENLYWHAQETARHARMLQLEDEERKNDHS